MEYHCIVCSKPIGESGFLGTIEGISVTFCQKHAQDCMANCETCIHERYPVCHGRG